jgi:hypothetical protein
MFLASLFDFKFCEFVGTCEICGAWNYDNHPLLFICVDWGDWKFNLKCQLILF